MSSHLNINDVTLVSRGERLITAPTGREREKEREEIETKANAGRILRCSGVLLPSLIIPVTPSLISLFLSLFHPSSYSSLILHDDVSVSVSHGRGRKVRV